MAGNAQASGFQIREQSATALGNALAGASAGGASGDVTLAAYNPAVIGFGQGSEIGLFGSYISPTFDITDAEASTNSTFGNVPYSGDPSQDGSTTAFVPSFAARWALDDQWSVGLVVSAPWGLKTEYDRDFVGRFYAIESDLVTNNINPVVSFNATDRLTLAGGIQAQYADATLSNAVDFGTVGTAVAADPNTPAMLAAALGAATPGDPNQEGFAEVTGDDWAFGFNLGLLFQVSDTTRIGASYHSEIDHEIEGDVDYESDSDGIRDVLTGANLFTESGGSANISTPATFSTGIVHSLNDRWTLLGEVSWTDWSSFDELRVEFGDDTPDSVKEEDWEDTYMISAGAEYALDGRWTLRGGVGFDESPVQDDTRSPRIPDSDRTWISIGATFAPNERFGITGAFTHVMLDDASIDLDGEKESNQFRGDLTADTEGSVDIVAIQANWRF
ncbi:OmpP1/FadL family transporter [Spiribacter halobius]|uniref:OmpP1/FadL family transporter n=1 Tax=Sediminicurvatus halobius TaxID=2182432 RepID=UPI001304B192|nr:outer membrane protein transport protein [Spiribacter halobius]